MTQHTVSSNEELPFNRWDLIARICEDEKVVLYDLEVTGGILKVFIDAEDGVQHAHCAGVSNKILNHSDVEKILPGSTILEVSSPGVNRKLTRSEHFASAIDDRLKVGYKDAATGKKTIVLGVLKRIDDGKLVIETPKDKKREAQVIEVPLTAVTDARIDFLFKLG